ncbi:hypothetical protein RF11_01070 [Thelohanellus kitauei]|uniref:Uncharacterized protein n=1 Tax=Thelohanellus kitauei TaxID=669202 RepID=A0A0C2MX26_THEKT|nr:hypothetical protein RF11_01070 [Thelohanellus kitauei]
MITAIDYEIRHLYQKRMLYFGYRCFNLLHRLVNLMVSDLYSPLALERASTTFSCWFLSPFLLSCRIVEPTTSPLAYFDFMSSRNEASLPQLSHMKRVVTFETSLYFLRFCFVVKAFYPEYSYKIKQMSSN